MKDPKHPSGSSRRARPPVALATGLCLSAFGASCGPPERAALPESQPKVTAVNTQPLLGAERAGTITAAGTVINTYAALAADAKAGDGTLTVVNAAALNLKAGDLIMVVQLQGAVIESSDAAGVNGYGLVKTLSGAGNYEIASVKAVDTNTNVITLNYCAGLKNAYTTASHSQVVRVPQYTTLEIQSGASITALPWDGEKGGVVAAYVQGKTSLAGNIDASATGFRGGAVTNSAQDAAKLVTTYRSTAVADGAERGEGIAGYAKEYTDFGGRYGRGAAANAGGGGNSYNGGGGGGANHLSGKDWTGQGVMSQAGALTGWALDPGYKSNGNKLTTSSGGGRGGYTDSTNLQLTALKGPGDTSWGGNNRQEAGGLGGRPLNNHPRTALFLGGGGGAGNGNDGAAGGGGRGGGLIFLVTGALEGAGAIVSKGGAGERTKLGSAGSDGAGGGGGGGTVVVLAGRQLGSSAKLTADGGGGGNQFITVNNAADGPGGGGGGGYIGTFTPLPTTVTRSAVGAAAGVTDSGVMTLFPTNGATAGGDGKADDTYSYADGTQMPVCVPADVSVGAVLTRGKASPGNTAEFTVVITNSGPEPAQAVGITDALSAGVGTVTWTCTGRGGATCPAATGSGSIASIADLPIQGALTYVVTVPLPNTFTGPLTYDVGALVPPGFNDLKLGNNNPTVMLPSGTLPAADLAITLSSLPNPAPSGQPIVYNVGVQNRGPGTATGVSFTYTAPPGSTFPNLTAPLGWSCPPPAPQVTAVVCSYLLTNVTLGVPPGDLPTVQITVLPPSGSADIKSSATVAGQGITDPNPANNTAADDTLIGSFPAADIILGINGTPSPAPSGTAVSYALRITNTGPSLATGATMNLAVPFGSTIQSYDNTAAGWTCTSAGSSVTCIYPQNFPQGTLPPVTITVLPAPLATLIQVTAQGRGRGVADPNLANNTATEVVPIGDTAPTADLVLTVTTTPAEPRPGQPVVYNLNVANQGPGAATGAVLTYDIPSGGTVQNITAPSGWSCAQLTDQHQVSCSRSAGPSPQPPSPARCHPSVILLRS